MRNSSLLCVLLALGTLQLAAQSYPGSMPKTTPTPTPAPTATPTPATTKPGTAAAKPAKPGDKKDEEAKEKEKEGVIDGIAIARPDGRWLGITTAGNTFKVSFYDKKKKPENADVPRGTARWNHPRKLIDVNTVLNPSGAQALATPPLLKPPYVYAVRVALIGADEKVKESYTVQLKPGAGDPAPDPADLKP